MTEISEQLIFNLNRKGNTGLENFYISKSNDLAVSTVKNWRNWPTRKLILMGPTGSGKSHLANFWVEQVGAQMISISDMCTLDVVELSENKALLIDNIDEVENSNLEDKILIEEKLFHLINSMAHTSCYLMITSSTIVSTWGFKLPDLMSRLKTMAVVELLPPDDELLVAVLLKQFDDKQIKVSPEFVLFVSKRINRSFSSIREFVTLIDELTLKQKRDVTIPIASRILDSLDKSNIRNDNGNSFDPHLIGSDLFG